MLSPRLKLRLEARLIFCNEMTIMGETTDEIDRMLMPPPSPKRLKVEGKESSLKRDDDSYENSFQIGAEVTPKGYEQIQNCKHSSSASSNISAITTSDVRFRDIIGHAAAKLRLDEALLPLALPSSLADSILTGVRSAPASILLHGPPGCGKTQLARAVAGEAQAAFIPIGPSDILSKFVGESEATVRKLFQEAKVKAFETESNCAVIFFDEIDALGQSRGGNTSISDNSGSERENSSGGSRRLLAEILIQMTALTNESSNTNESEDYSYHNVDNVDQPITPNYRLISDETVAVSPSEGQEELESEYFKNTGSVSRRNRKPRVIVIAATNRPEDCDPALLRRFAVRVLVDLPSRHDRKRIIRRLLTNIEHTIAPNQLNDLAVATDGWSGSDLESLTREAVMAPIRECLRLAAATKSRSRKRHQRGVESSQSGDKTNDDDDSARELLLNSFRDLRPVTLEDFESAVSFWMGDQVTHGSSHNSNANNQHHDAYDSDSSSDEEQQKI